MLYRILCICIAIHTDIHRIFLKALPPPQDQSSETGSALVSLQNIYKSVPSLRPQPARLPDLRGQNARHFHVRELPRRDRVVPTAYHTGRGPKLRWHERDLRRHRRPPPGNCRASLSAGRGGRSRRRTERFSFGQRHGAVHGPELQTWLSIK